ncbi:MAG TPA: hypothetical protein IAB50_10210 [Candidatus Faecivicinus avistercoris]|nr:hypothetical protein [Candidatus Faecivicinus avistercoris]
MAEGSALRARPPGVIHGEKTPALTKAAPRRIAQSPLCAKPSAALLSTPLSGAVDRKRHLPTPKQCRQANRPLCAKPSTSLLSTPLSGAIYYEKAPARTKAAPRRIAHSLRTKPSAALLRLFNSAAWRVLTRLR